MKGLGLAILWLARVAEVGLKNSNLQSPKIYPSPVNQTCHCNCSCIHSTLALERFPIESFAGTFLALVLWKLLSWLAGRAHEPQPSPRRRGAGIVTMPARTTTSCVVQWWPRVPWANSSLASWWQVLVCSYTRQGSLRRGFFRTGRKWSSVF